MIKQLLLVGLGGGLGSMLRYLTSVATAKYYDGTFPLATFLVNMAGCLLIGMLVGIMGETWQLNSNYKLLLITGFCGGFTTFSAFAMENIALIQQNHYSTVVVYIVASALVGLLAVWAGIELVKLF